MPVWVLPLVIKFVLPFLLQELVKSGAMSELEASAIKGIGDLVAWAKNLKIEATFPKRDDDPTHNFNRQPS